MNCERNRKPDLYLPPLLGNTENVLFQGPHLRQYVYCQIEMLLLCSCWNKYCDKIFDL